MSVARHHAEWLSLLETSGSFLSLPVLLRVFPQGLDAHDPELARALRLAYDEWDGSRVAKRPDPAIHREWLRFVLEEALGFPKEILLAPEAFPRGLEAPIAEHHETLRPDLAIVAPQGRPDAGSPRLLVQLVPPGQHLERTLAGAAWKVSPASRITELLKATGVRLGLLTNGEDWMLVHRGESFTYVTWSAPLWFEEPLTLRAFTSLFSARRLFGVADEETLEALFTESQRNQQEVTDQLGFQVRRAVEMLVQALDRCDKDLGRALLAGVSEGQVYEAVLTVMMRLVFLFSAEERGLLLLGDPLYDRFYAVSTLGAQLREEADRHGQALLERRHDAWPRLLALFRAVYGGLVHDSLQIPAYGGALFDPDRYPFLEGRAPGTRWHDTAAAPLPINNRTVLHVLEALQFLRLKVPGGGPAEPRRLSFRGLGIEQIGHVYEGLLDHSTIRATDPVLGLAGSRDKEEEVPLAELEGYRSRGADDLVQFLTARTGRSQKALSRAFSQGSPPLREGGAGGGWSDNDLLMACDNDAALVDRVRPFAPLLRRDDNDAPLVVTQGSLYVTRTGDRRSTGTHYTPPELTEPVVQHTLEPLVYDGPAEGKPREEWRLRTPRELLALRVCDIAMGSGAFLVQACRYLAERLVEAWEEVERAAPGRVLITPEGDLSVGDPGERLIPRDPDERLTIARRIIADRCLFGVDKNPQAVEMAKLSLWLVTSAKGRPFTFLDHALRCGDSLVGADEEMFLSWTRLGGKEGGTLYDDELRRALEVARAKRLELESFEVKDVRDAERKASLLAEAERATARVKLGCDLIVGTKLLGLNARDEKARLSKAFLSFQRGGEPTDYVALESLREARRARAFHWHLEFPDVFAEGGFSAIVGNPPFLGAMRIAPALGDRFQAYLKGRWNHRKGAADLVAYFLLRAFELLRNVGNMGLVATNTVTQGNTRFVGLDRILHLGGALYWAVKSMRWPGTANVYISLGLIHKGEWGGRLTLEGKSARAITSTFDDIEIESEPHRLSSLPCYSSRGTTILGIGFVLSPKEASVLLQDDPRNAEVLFPYLTAEDLSTTPDQSATRQVINFFEWPLEKAMTYRAPFEIVQRRVRPQREKPQRQVHEACFWKYSDKRPELYRNLETLDEALVVGIATKYFAPTFVPARQVFADKVVVFATEARETLAVLTSALHLAWFGHYMYTLKGDPCYSLRSCFQTFPFPGQHAGLAPYGHECHQVRRQTMMQRQEGLTVIYNRFHDRKEASSDIARLRDLHVEMDNAVAAAYGWTDLDLGHGFRETQQGLRFTLSDPARREVLSRLLALNHARHAAEKASGVKAKRGVGLSTKGRRRGKGGRTASSQKGLFE